MWITREANLRELVGQNESSNPPKAKSIRYAFGKGWSELIAVGLVGTCLTATILLSVVSTQWQVLYDDAYISFRYAQNLAEGHGLTWNIGEPPTEGYSNLLFVISIAPFIYFDLDPLIVARTLSLAAWAVSFLGIYLVSRRGFRSSIAAALFAGFGFLMMPSSLSLVMTGLETVAYTTLLLAAAVTGAALVAHGKRIYVLGFCFFAIACVLMRPDGALICVVVVFVYFFQALRKQLPWAPILIVVGVFLGAATLLLAWKQTYFGELLPNPYFIKSGGIGFDPRGLESIRQFFGTYGVLICFALLGSLLILRESPRSNSTATFRRAFFVVSMLFIVTTLVYFSTTATLMDIHGRFLFPLTALLFVLSVPFFSMLATILFFRGGRLILSVAATVMILIVVSGIQVTGPTSLLTPLSASQIQSAFSSPRSLNAQWALAENLKRYPMITSTRIAFGDAGIVPFVTKAPWLDTVGLNDSYIARSSDLSKLTDYFFAREPDIVFLGSNPSGGWFSDGHGPLGDFNSWSQDPRWDGYIYVGSVRRSDLPYDNVLLVRKATSTSTILIEYLRTHVVDGWYSTLPWDLGTNKGDASADWVNGPRFAGSQ